MVRSSGLMPTVEMAGVGLDRFDFDSVDMRFDLAIDNPNGVAIDLAWFAPRARPTRRLWTQVDLPGLRRRNGELEGVRPAGQRRPRNQRASGSQIGDAGRARPVPPTRPEIPSNFTELTPCRSEWHDKPMQRTRFARR